MNSFSFVDRSNLFIDEVYINDRKVTIFHNTPFMKRKLEFGTAYHQFYILGKGTTGDTGAGDFLSESAFTDRLAVTNGLLAISTASYGRIQAEITLLKEPRERIVPIRLLKLLFTSPQETIV